MNTKLPWLVVHRIKKLHRAVKRDDKLAYKINTYLDNISYGCDDTNELMNSKIVVGEIIEQDGNRYLKVKGQEPAKLSQDGVANHTACTFEDWATGELYLRVSKNKWLQIFYNG